MRVVFNYPDLMMAIVRSYAGPHHASVQFDPPVHRADGRWFAWLMVRDPRHGDYSITGGNGATDLEALVSLAGMCGLEIEHPELKCDVCGKKIDGSTFSHDYTFPGGLVLDVCSMECLDHLN